jgi:glucose-1-phosphate thymidylyltransferase
VEYTFIIAPTVGEQIPSYMANQYPGINVHYFTQHEMSGQSQAVALASEYLRGPTIVIYADTLIETDFSFLAEEKPDAVAWVKTVPDPRRFGVAVTGEDGYIRELVEKPLECDNRLAVVGCYYFTKGEELAAAIEEQFRLKKKFSNEYFLTDAINILLNLGTKMRTREVDSWLDTGTIEATLETNRILLARTHAGVPARWNPEACKQANVSIVPPVFIHETAELRNALIGPYASIGADCQITNSRIEDSILERGVTVQSAALKGSFIGRQARIEGRSADDPHLVLNVGDNSSVVQK